MMPGMNPFGSESHESGSGDPKEFQETFLEFFPRLRSFFRTCGFSTADAEDLSQTTLWNVYRAGEQFRGEGSLESWIYAAARNAARDEWRRRSRREDQAPDREPQEPGSPADAILASRQELSETVRELLAMPTGMRTCLLLRVREGLSYRDIGRRLSLSAHTVKVQIWNARRRLKSARESPR